MKTIHLKAILEKLIFDACLSMAGGAAPGRFRAVSCIMYVERRAILHFLWWRRHSERVLSPLSSPVPVGIAPALCFIAPLFW